MIYGEPSQVYRSLRDPDSTMCRHTAQIIPSLEPVVQKAAVDSYADALRVVFICQAAISVLGFLACLPIQESALSYVRSRPSENSLIDKGKQGS